MTAADRIAKAKARADVAHLRKTTLRYGYDAVYTPTTRVRGWPAPSSRPFSLYMVADGHATHAASFATFEGLERGFRARAGL